jgi:hypothetical protein
MRGGKRGEEDRTGEAYGFVVTSVKETYPSGEHRG